jgi:predicted GH43/DUF377 family glycosyl hydrolase
MVFPCGAIADYERNVLRLYYGASDNYLFLAIGSIKEVVQVCLAGMWAIPNAIRGWNR